MLRVEGLGIGVGEGLGCMPEGSDVRMLWL